MIDIGSICHLIRAGQVPAFGVRQPWAHRIIHCGRDIENISSDPHYRGWIMLYAGLALDYRAFNDGLCNPSDRSIGYPIGGIVGIVRIEMATRADPSPWFCGPVGLVLKNPVALPLIKCGGAYGFFKPDADVGKAVIAALIERARK